MPTQHGAFIDATASLMEMFREVYSGHINDLMYDDIIFGRSFPRFKVGYQKYEYSPLVTDAEHNIKFVEEWV